MTGLKVGASLADGAPKVWNGSAFVAPKQVSVWDGAEYVKVWPTMTPEYTRSHVLEGSSTTNTSITTEGSAGCVIVFSVSNDTEYARLDGTDMTRVYRGNGIAFYYAVGLSAGSHSIEVSRVLTGGYILGFAAYSGVNAVTGDDRNTGSGRFPSATPSGSGALAVAGYSLSNVSSGDENLITSNGDIREAYRRTSGSNLVLADSATSPIDLTTVDSGDWQAVGVWLA